MSDVGDDAGVLREAAQEGLRAWQTQYGLLPLEYVSSLVSPEQRFASESAFAVVTFDRREGRYLRMYIGRTEGPYQIPSFPIGDPRDGYAWWEVRDILERRHARAKRRLARFSDPESAKDLGSAVAELRHAIETSAPDLLSGDLHAWQRLVEEQG